MALGLGALVAVNSCSAAMHPEGVVPATAVATGAASSTSANTLAATQGPRAASAGEVAGSWDPMQHPDREATPYGDDALALEYPVWEAGKAWKVRGIGYEPNAKIELEFRPTVSGEIASAEADQFQPQPVGEPLVVTADENGTVAVLVFVPLSMQAGTYSLTAYAGDMAASTSLEVVAPA